MRASGFLLALILLAGCHRSGTWVDDPENFRRAWSVDPPPDISVVHSLYKRSSHFTLEEVYYFQLEAPEGFTESFVAENGLTSDHVGSLDQLGLLQPVPTWFAPHPVAEYRVWRGKDHPTVVVLLHRESGHVYIHAAQL